MTTQTPSPAQASDEPMRELPESWRNSNISWICHHLKENTIFDVDRLQREWDEMKALAIQAATPRATADVERDAALTEALRDIANFRTDIGADETAQRMRFIAADALKDFAATKGAKL